MRTGKALLTCKGALLDAQGCSRVRTNSEMVDQPNSSELGRVTSR
jgi:hypothetical protein